ncbi:hypothetical protein J3R30DRAFT_649097 [Lentinula aciculospora]|uniref:Uncharacterized protein n=1 Tax=Lentinula aciculospora TaxID=153920 RepID=A0A9W9A5B5_9AGAR|nr:hypothetical protein J3R30DRAFT_649097 [Lentinula aciculospora]
MFIRNLWIVSFSVALISSSYYAWFTPSIISRIHDIFSSPSITKAQTSLATSLSTPPINCTSPPPHTCTFYSACLESHFHCGPEGYPLGFGEKFCTKFNMPQNVERLSTKGKDWMWTTMGCLQRALVSELDVPVVSSGLQSSSTEDVCKALEDKAFSTHAPCYLSSGLCSLSLEDWVVIVDIIDIKTLLSSWDAFEGGVDAGKGCLEFFSHKFWRTRGM